LASHVADGLFGLILRLENDESKTRAVLVVGQPQLLHVADLLKDIADLRLVNAVTDAANVQAVSAALFIALRRALVTATAASAKRPATTRRVIIVHDESWTVGLFL